MLKLPQQNKCQDFSLKVCSSEITQHLIIKSVDKTNLSTFLKERINLA